MNAIIGLLVGALFGAGLALSGMTDTQKVIGFLDLFGAWDMTLAFVMGGGLLVTVPAFYLLKNKQKPLFSAQFHLPTSKDVDAPLLLGAALFGVGWGLYGYCPGPAISSLAYGQLDTIYFVIAMSVGMWCVRFIPLGK